MVNLRGLKKKDAPYMLDWMRDSSVIKDLKNDFSTKTMDDCLLFISKSIEDDTNIHFAVVDEGDIYQGTVSLKNLHNKCAEFAIVLSSLAIGTGAALEAMNKILDFGFGRVGLETIYWCVSPRNSRAVRFYEKNSFQRMPLEKISIIEGYTESQINEYYWFFIEKENWKNSLII